MKIKISFWLIMIFWFASQTWLAFAEDIHKLDGITVEGQRETSAERNVRQIQIKENATPAVSSIPDVLDQTSGLDIQRRSTLTPKNSQVRIRGLDERRSLIMLDGRPLNGTGVMGGYFVDWSSISSQQWRAVDVGKGAFSAKYGNTLGGTINMIPKIPDEEAEFTLSGGYQRYETFGMDASASGRTGAFGTVLNAGYHETDGHLRNSRGERQDYGGRFHYFWGDDGEIHAAFRYTRGDFNMPVENRKDTPGYDDAFPESSGTYLAGPGIKFPTGDAHGDDSYYTKKRHELDFGFKKRISGIDAEATIYYNNEDRDDTIYSYDQEDIIMERECTPDRSWGWGLSFSKTTASHTFGMGADANYQGYGGTKNTFVKADYFAKAPTDGADEWDATRRYGIYADDQWTLSERVDIYLGLRYEDYYGDRIADAVGTYTNGKPGGFERVDANFDEETFLPKFGAVYRPSETLALHGRVARATRFPDNPAFYWYYGGYRPEVDPASDVKRKDLTYEDAMEYETGLTFTTSDMTLGLNYYYYEVDDYIRWIFGYAPSRTVYNIDQVMFQGLELDAEGRLFENIYAFANVTWQETKKEGDVLDGSNALTDELSELPEMKANLGLKYERKDGALAKLALRWVDSREVPYMNASGDQPDGAPVGKAIELKKMDAFITADLLFEYPIWKNGFQGILSAGVENLFDEEYEEEYDFPSPEQTFSVGLEFEF